MKYYNSAEILKVVNPETNIPFVIRIIRKGNNYGLEGCLVHEEEDPLVEFYDARYDFDEFGQFTGGRYYVKTLLGEDGFGHDISEGKTGLSLDLRIPQWSIDADNCKKIGQWLRQQINS